MNDNSGEHLGVAGTIKAKATGIVEDIKEMGKEQIATQKQATAKQVDKIAGVVERAVEELGRGDFPSLAAYANQLSARIKNFADELRDRNIEEWVDDIRQAARRNPQMFLAGSIAGGIILSRFFKASQRRDAQNSPAGSWKRWDTDSQSDRTWDASSEEPLDDPRMESLGG